MGLNLHAMVRGPINAVNPDRPALWVQNAGTGPTADDGTRKPEFVTAEVMVQSQPLTSDALMRQTGIVMQGVLRRLHLNGDAQGIVRRLKLGGDRFEFDGQCWKVVQVLETWGGAGEEWCAVAVVLQ